MKRSGDALYAREVNELFAGFDRSFTGGEGLHFSHGPGGSHVTMPRAPSGLTREASSITLGLNTGLGALPSYSPCEIVGSVYSGATAEQRRALKVKVPTASAKNKFAVCAEPLAIERAGRIHVAGVCLCRVRTNSGDLYADVAASGDTFLTGSPTDGGAQILWEDGGSSTTTHLALIRFPRGGGTSFTPSYARIATDVPITLANIQTIDGALLFDGDHVLVTAQTNPIDNGLYICKAGASWIRTGTLMPAMIVAIFEGSEYASTLWILEEQSTVVIGSTALPFRCMRQPAVRTARVATTAPITLSGTQTIDGIAVQVGDWVLVRAQGGLGGTGDGFMRCASSAWYYDPFSQPSIVHVREGTANSSLTFFSTPSGWLANYGVYA